MNRVAFRIFGIEIMWYGIIIALAMVVGVKLVLRNSKKIGIKEDDMLDIALVALPCAIIGARLYYVIFNFSLYQDNLWSIFNTRLGGMAIHGGLIGGFAGGLAVGIRRKLNVIRTADVIAPSVILGQAIGRWGNFINQEAHGGPTDLPWGIMVDGVKVHPTFLYESIWNLIIFGVLMKVFQKKKYDGQMVAIYLVGYSLGRFFIEGLRTDSLMFGSMRAAQLISMLMIAIGAGVHFYFSKRPMRPAYVGDQENDV